MEGTPVPAGTVIVVVDGDTVGSELQKVMDSYPQIVVALAGSGDWPLEISRPDMRSAATIMAGLAMIREEPNPLPALRSGQQRQTKAEWRRQIKGGGR